MYSSLNVSVAHDGRANPALPQPDRAYRDDLRLVQSRGQSTAPGAARRRAAPGWWRDAWGVAVWTSVLVVTIMWIEGHGVQSLSSSRSILLTSIGRLSGFIGADLLLIQVILMARVPFIERSFGQVDLARHHRTVGFLSFAFVVLHVTVTTFGYAGAAGRSVATESWALMKDAGFLAAAVGTAALTLVVVTSIAAARQRLRYESWHLLHVYAYLGIALALPHQLWNGTDLVRSGVDRLYWYSLYLLAVGCVVGCRIVLPVWRTVRHRPFVSSVVEESGDAVSIHISGRHLQRLEARAGQFFIWRFMSGTGWTRGHPYSLSSVPTDAALRITVKRLGADSSRVGQLKVGTKAVIEGPYGVLTAERRTKAHVTFIASGIGITPLRALAEELSFSKGEGTLLYRASTSSDFLFTDELSMLAERGLNVIYIPGRRSRTRSSWLPDCLIATDDARALREFVPHVAVSDVFVCGPAAWMDAVIAAARAAGVPRPQIHSERFAW
jgi:predicted ferric reductase